MNWSFKWLTKGGKITLIKSVLEAIPVYWMHFRYLWGLLKILGSYASNSYGQGILTILDYCGPHGKIQLAPNIWEDGG